MSVTVFDVLSQFTMLMMLLSLSLGWTLASAHSVCRYSHFRSLAQKPAAHLVGVLGFLQVMCWKYFSWCKNQMDFYTAYLWSYFVFPSLSFTFASSNMILSNIFIFFIPFFCKDTGVCMMIKNHSVFKLSIPCFFTIHHYYSPKLFAILTLHYLQLLLFFGQILSCIL